MRKHHAFGKNFLPSVLLHFDNQGSLAPCVKKRAYIFLFFSVLPRIRTSDRDERKHIILTWDRLGEITLGGIKETGKSGRQMYWEVKHEIFTTYYYDTAGNFFARLVLSIIKSVQVKPSRPLEIFTYSKDEELGHGQEDRNKGGVEDGGKGRYDTNLPLSKLNLAQANNRRYPQTNRSICKYLRYPHSDRVWRTFFQLLRSLQGER